MDACPPLCASSGTPGALPEGRRGRIGTPRTVTAASAQAQAQARAYTHGLGLAAREPRATQVRRRWSRRPCSLTGALNCQSELLPSPRAEAARSNRTRVKRHRGPTGERWEGQGPDP